MTLQLNREIRLFDSFGLVIPPKLKYHTDGLPGHRVLFITDAKETFNVSFGFVRKREHINISICIFDCSIEIGSIN